MVKQKTGLLDFNLCVFSGFRRVFSMIEEEKLEIYKQTVEMLEEKNLRALGAFLSLQRGSYVAEVVELLDNTQKRRVFDVLDKELAAEVLEKVDEATRAELFDEVLENKEIANLVSELSLDEAADVLAEMDEQESQEILANLDDEDARQIQGLMKYEEDSAGGIMQPMILAVEENLTIQQTIDLIRQAKGEEEFYCIFVVDKQRRFLGTVGIRHLLIGSPQTPLGKIVDSNALYVMADTHQEEIRNLFKKNNLLVAPVVDAEHRLVGGITADRVIEAAEEEAIEDIYAMAGTDAEELENFSALHTARVRMTWLLPCLLGTAITALAGLFFRNLFAQWDQLAIFITAFLFAPMIAAISGNAGLQTSAVVVCGLATGDMAALRIGQVFWREVRVAVLVALCCGTVGGLICGVLPRVMEAGWRGKNATVQTTAVPASDLPSKAISPLQKIRPGQHLRIAAALGIAMFSAIMVSTTLGMLLPFVFRRIGWDPAISAGPLVTTANDSVSVIIYMLLTILTAR
ncbi:MAG: magnesium transporter [Planctomycetes bacterium]|nr:magnesium transporter [Planctomycetota bacterium]